MTPVKDAILAHLRSVEALRQQRAASPDLAARVQAVKSWQQRRFSHTYADLLASARYAPAANFFLRELYGPGDYSRRDAQFARVVPALVRMFPDEVVATVAAMSELHALSERLDTAMGGHLAAPAVDALGYTQAWQATGAPADRDAQIALVLKVGRTLDRVTRSTLLRHSLRLMRGPAAAAGLGELQTMLEAGFDTFRSMRGADEFLSTVGRREQALAKALFDAPPGTAPVDLLPAS